MLGKEGIQVIPIGFSEFVRQFAALLLFAIGRVDKALASASGDKRRTGNALVGQRAQIV